MRVYSCSRVPAPAPVPVPVAVVVAVRVRVARCKRGRRLRVGVQAFCKFRLLSFLFIYLRGGWAGNSKFLIKKLESFKFLGTFLGFYLKKNNFFLFKFKFFSFDFFVYTKHTLDPHSA